MEMGETFRMLIPEARNYLGRRCSVTYRDRGGDQRTRTMRIDDIAFVPMYGPCLVGDVDDVWLDRVTSISAVE